MTDTIRVQLKLVPRATPNAPGALRTIQVHRDTITGRWSAVEARLRRAGFIMDSEFLVLLDSRPIRRDGPVEERKR